MKKIGLLLLALSLVLVGCNSTDKNKVKREPKEVVEETKNEDKYLKAGEVFIAKDDRGSYEFKVLDANYLGIHDGDQNKNLRLQVVWEVNNIDFKGSMKNLDGSIVEDVVNVDSNAIKVKDDKGYILNKMSTGWDGDWSNTWIALKPGEKAIQKYTWILNNDDTEYIYVSYPRMENIEYKVKVNK